MSKLGGNQNTTYDITSTMRALIKRENTNFEKKVLPDQAADHVLHVYANAAILPLYYNYTTRVTGNQAPRL